MFVASSGVADAWKTWDGDVRFHSLDLVRLDDPCGFSTGSYRSVNDWGGNRNLDVLILGLYSYCGLGLGSSFKLE